MMKRAGPVVRVGAALLLLAAMPPARAQEPTEPAAAASTTPPKAIPDSFAEAVGTWDLSLDGGNRRCVLTLSGDNSSNGRILRFPAGCRRAVPVLNAVAGWLFADGGIRFVDRNIRPLLQFSARADRRSLLATSESGETYNLVPLQTVAMLPPAPEPDGASRGEETARPTSIPDVTGARAIPGSQPVLSGAVVASKAPGQPAEIAPMPGVYALDRFNAKDVCRIELAAQAPGGTAEPGLAPARLLPGCRDSGIAVFDPGSWRFANGHMTLKSKRGHAINLVASGEGSWRRDPETGAALVLRKVER